jgi:3-oxoacyl-[acyl-carrier protein] reductase
MPSSLVSARPVALITGAAGGLGQALVAEFASHGWRVVAACHRQPAHPETGTVWPLPLDVTNCSQVAAAVARVRQRWDAIQVLINNAGLTADQSVWQLSETDWDRVLAVNLKGAFLCSQAVLPAMVQQRDGQIINVASFSARQGTRGQANYAAAKAGLIGLTQSLAKEVGPCNVRVNAVLPGVLPTPMTAPLGPKRLAELAHTNALGRLNSLAEVARFMAFLASLQNVSGQLFQLDSRICPWA